MRWVAAAVLLACLTALCGVSVGADAPRVAVIVADGDDTVRDIAALVDARLAADGMDTVERARLRDIFGERNLRTLLGTSGAERRRAGGLLRAEFLAILRGEGAGKTRRLRLVLAETRYGYHLANKAFPWGDDPEKLAAACAASVRRGAGALADGLRLAVAIPPFHSDDLDHARDYLQHGLADLAAQEVQATPGCVVVELEEARAIGKELLTGEGDDRVRRGLPFYLTGRYRHAGVQRDAAAAVAVRFERNGKSLAVLKREVPDHAAAAGFVRQSVRRLLADQTQDAPAGASGAAEVEVRKLLAEAGDFRAVGEFRECLGLSEAALLLEPGSVPAHRLALEATIDLLGMSLPGAVHERRGRLVLAARGMDHLTAVMLRSVPKDQKEQRRLVHGILEHTKRDLNGYRRAGLSDELAAIDRAAEDFFLGAYPYTYRRVKSLRWWDDATWAGSVWLSDFAGRRPSLPDDEVFALRLRQLNTFYKGKPYKAWPIKLVTGLMGAEQGDDPKAYAAYVEGLDRFLRTLAESDDPVLAALGRCAPLEVGFSKTGASADLADLMAIESEAQRTQRDGITAAVQKMRDLLRPFGVGFQHSTRRRSALQRPPGTMAGLYGRVALTEVEIHVPGLPDLLDGHSYLGLHLSGVTRCGPGVDALWGTDFVAIVRGPGDGTLVVSRQRDGEVTDVRWDGARLWVGTRQGKLLLVDPFGKHPTRTIGRADGLPNSEMGMVIMPLRTGVACVTGSLAPHGRAWCANVTADGKVDLFHEAREVRDGAKEARSDEAFVPRWVWAMRSPDTGNIERIWVGRDARRDVVFSFHLAPLLVDPIGRSGLTAEFTLPAGSRVRNGEALLRVGDRLITGGFISRLPGLTDTVKLWPEREIDIRRFINYRGDVIGIGRSEWVKVDLDVLQATPLIGPDERGPAFTDGWSSEVYGVLTTVNNRSFRLCSAEILPPVAQPLVPPPAPEAFEPPAAVKVVALPPDVPRRALRVVGPNAVQNAMTGELLEDIKEFDLPAAAGEVLLADWAGDAPRYPYIVTGEEAGPVHLSSGRAKGALRTFVRSGNAQTLYGLRLFGDCDAKRLEATVAGSPNLRFLSIEAKNLKDLSALSGLRDLVALELERCALTDLKALESLPCFRRLAYLRVSRSSLNDVTSVARMPRLRVLLLDDASSLERIEPIGQCKSLQWLRLGLSRAHPPDLAPLAGLPSLRRLYLRGCDPEQQLSALRNLPRLEEITVAAEGLTDVTPLTRFPALRRVKIVSADRLDIAPLAACTRLESIESNRELRNIAALAALPRLTRFHARVDKPRDLGRFVRLRDLETEIDGMSDAHFLAPLVHLERLVLKRTEALADIRGLAGMKRLQWLEIQHAPALSDISPLAGMSEVRRLRLTGTAVADLGPLAGMAEMTFLDLSDSRRIDNAGRLPGLAPLTEMRKLERLILTGCERVPGLDALRDHPALRRLDMGGCGRITSLADLGDPPNLQHLYGSRTGVSKEEVTAFKKRHPRCSINVRQ